MIKMEKDGLYLSALDNAKTVVQQLCSNFFLKKPSLYMYSRIVSLKMEDMHTFAPFKLFF